MTAGLLRYYQTHSTPNKRVPHSQATRDKIRQSALKAGVGKWNKGRKAPWNYSRKKQQQTEDN
jgi:hypothetical protein